jgi:hypothetical protein
VLHDCEGGYEGSVRRFELSRSSVSAHYVVREDGSEATQMVYLADSAWHACTFNRRSVGVEMGGFASCGFDAPLLATCARVSAFLCYHLQIPVRHARAGVDRVLPRTKISALRVAIITIRPTTRASCRDLLAWSARPS